MQGFNYDFIAGWDQTIAWNHELRSKVSLHFRAASLPERLEAYPQVNSPQGPEVSPLLAMDISIGAWQPLVFTKLA